MNLIRLRSIIERNRIKFIAPGFKQTGTDLNVEFADKDSIPMLVNYFDPQILSLNKIFAKQL